MERAGLAVARLGMALAPHAQRALVLAGPGNNGGDGLIAARHLQRAGLQVTAFQCGDPTQLPADAAAAMQGARQLGVAMLPVDQLGQATLASHDIAIDALLGLGAARAPAGWMAQAITILNALSCTRLAVDLPSGLDPDRGCLLGNVAVQAHATLSLLTLKPGCFTAGGRDHAGQVWWAPLGVAQDEPTAWLSGPAPGTLRRHAQHKGSFGDVMVVGGAPGMTGAAWLAASAALAAGAGRVYASPLDDSTALPQGRPELMLRLQGWLAAPAALAELTVVCGCGGGSAVAAALPPLLAHAGRLVLDADALNAIADDSGLRLQLQARGRRQQPAVLTPHPLEAARLLGCTVQQVQRDRLHATVELAAALGCCVVLKGSGTVVAAPGGLPHINPTGNAALGTAGTGDVLAGWLGGTWTQRGGDPSLTNAAAVARSACWQHGAAADRYLAAGRQGPLLAADLVTEMAADRPCAA